jgi:pyridoxine kinase
MEAARALEPSEVVVTAATVSAEAIGMVLRDGARMATARQQAIAGSPKGTGDLFAALYLGHRLDGRDAREAMQRAASAVGRLVRRAAVLGVDELPLAEAGDELAGDPADVVVTAWPDGRRQA